MVGSLAVTPLRFTGDFLTALAAADDQRGIADILSGELHDRLRLDGVLVHEHLAGRNHTWAQRGAVRPPIAPRIAAVRSGGTQPGSFGYASAGTTAARAPAAAAPRRGACAPPRWRRGGGCRGARRTPGGGRLRCGFYVS